MPEEPLRTFDQTLIDKGVLPYPDIRDYPERLKRSAAKFAKNTAILTLVAQHLFVAVRGMDNQAKLEEQLKFQGLRAYARINNLRLSAIFVDHFLYGNGEPLDITEDFAIVLKEDAQSEFSSPQTLGITEEMSTEEVYEKYAQNAFARVVRGPDAEEKAIFLRTLDEEGNEIYHTTDELPNLIGQNIRMFRIDELIGDDSFYSLGNFTISMEGTLLTIDGDGNITLENPHISIDDNYNWRRGLDLNAETSVGNLVAGTLLEQVFPDGVKDINISVSDDDGATLEEEGIAHPFEVSANVKIAHPVTVSTNNISLPQHDN